MSNHARYPTNLQEMRDDEKGVGLFTIDIVEPSGAQLTFQGPASEALLAMLVDVGTRAVTKQLQVPAEAPATERG